MDEKKFVVREAQKEYIAVLANRVKQAQAQFQAKLNEFIGALNEGVDYIKKDLGVPLDQPYKLTEDGSEFVLAPEPEAPKAA